jgi:Fe-S cluster assembly protein SufD
MSLSHYETLYPHTQLASCPAWQHQLRQNAWQAFLQQGIPQSKQDAWKYTRTHQFTTLSPKLQLIQPSVQSNYLPDSAWEKAFVVVFLNGKLIKLPTNLPPQITLCSLKAVMNDAALCAQLELPSRMEKLLGCNGDGFIALNSALWQDGLVLHVQPGFTLSTPIHCIYLNNHTSDSTLNVMRHFILLGAYAQATLIEQYEGIATDSIYGITNSASEIFLEAAARLTQFKIGLEPATDYHLDNTRIALAEHSVYRGYAMAFAQNWARCDWRVTLQAPYANAEINGLFFANQKQFIDHQITMDHQSLHGQSTQSFFGMVDDQAKAVCNGKVIVALAAHSTQAQQHNKNILLSPQAEIFAKPELQIYNQDVQCQHGATVGQLDPDALFYLQSRGLSFVTARQMLLTGFATQFTSSLPQALQQHAEKLIALHVSPTVPIKEDDVVN